MTDTLELLRSGHLKGAKRLDLAAGLTEFPKEILALADSLELLNLSDNHLKTLPDDFAQLQNLKIVFFNHNDFETLPPVLAQCPQLYMISFKANRIQAIAANALRPTVRWLTLTDNRLTQLPSTIGTLVNLQKLMLAGNQLRSLPAELANCQNLELIRLAANQLTELPPWLFTLPRLSWLAYAGNPLCAKNAVVLPPLPLIDWHDLTPGDLLGQGASGLIYKGIWQNQTGITEVAIKIFKGEITSDGFPGDEMQACMAAGSHPNLVTLLGKLINHPEQKDGLIFAFLPPTYNNLGGPPSLETCTRDTYPAETAFSLPVAHQIAQGIASVTAHLHRQGILHGDLYAHNILVDAAGNGLLGDFGAASFYDSSDEKVAQSLERLEVRAFGCLLEDLLTRCSVTQSVAETPIFDRLRQLQQECMKPIPTHRPRFNEICDRLSG
ncbi:MAG: leucine-rich repeat-containing protein kinase family protein [Leptolyngbyaceae cyanobacterium bins.349]|nr:leucine-rich repeat-containing protein kinase family protein [Leptolyngbyaceae cyanobacterium bins.349]